MGLVLLIVMGKQVLRMGEGMQYKALMGTGGISGLLFLSGDRDVRLPRVREAVKWIGVSIGYGGQQEGWRMMLMRSSGLFIYL